MPSAWFNVPETGTGAGTMGDAYRPDYVESIAGIDSYTGQRLTDKSPRFTVRVFGTDAALSELESKSGVARIDDAKVQNRLTQVTGQERSRSEWDHRFTIA